MRVVGEAAPKNILTEVVGDAITHRHHAQREIARSQALRHRADVRHDVAVFEGKELASAAPSAHDFVAHQQNAVLL